MLHPPKCHIFNTTIVSLDLVTTLKRSQNGYRMVLIIVELMYVYSVQLSVESEIHFVCSVQFFLNQTNMSLCSHRSQQPLHLYCSEG